jgi:murein DD-endopeptidase MepM/ murein hydrolase activator NlpD
MVYWTLGLQAVVGGLMVGLSNDYANLKRESGQIAAVQRQAEEQRAFIEALRPRLAAMRSDVAEWGALHDKMWKALAPVTGAKVAAADVTAGVKRDASDLVMLETTVAEEGRRLRELARAASRTSKIVSALPLRWPIRGPVNSEYGRRRSPFTGRPQQHDGIDIGGLPGTPVKSPAAGTVVVARSRGGFGKHVTLDHGNGVRSLYGHLREITVTAGQRVEKGQVIGLVGSTGRSTGPHVHYKVIVNGKAVDPRGFLKAAPQG